MVAALVRTARAAAVFLTGLALLAIPPPGLTATASAPGRQEPLATVRIGLADGVPAARISAAAPFALRAGELVIEVSEALVTPETEPGESALALGSFASGERAREVAAAFRETHTAPPPVRVERDPESGRHLAVLPTLPASAAEAARLRAAGFPEAGVFRLPRPTGGALLVRPVGGSPIRFAAGVSLVAEPPPEAFLEWEGRPYRGSFEVFRSGAGVTVVNRTGLEDYLVGVVPRELPPDLFPEVEALKAQALAARTYALTPRPAYLERGYDLCATPACQVYGGVAAEHPLSTAAVRDTAGEAIYHDGKLIDALYTAACGGSTENAENVFSTPTPYLVARACIREAGGVRLRSDAALPLDAALLRLAGALPEEWDRAGALAEPASRQEAAAVLEAALGALGFPACDPGGGPGGAVTLGEFGKMVEASRCRDPAALLFGPGPDGGELAEGAPALGRLLAEGLFDPGDLGLDPARPVRRREVVGVAASLFLRDGQLFRRGQVREVEAAGDGVRLLVEEGGAGARGASPEASLVRLEPAPDAFLFREIRPARIPGRADPQPLPVPAGEVRLRVGDFVRYRATPRRPEGPSGETTARFDLLLLEDLGEALDRFSRQSSWLVPRNNDDLSAAVNRAEPIGRVTALEPVEYGASGRVARLRIVGTDGSLEVRGLRIRRLLGLAENLFRAEPRRNSRGEVTEWWFTGRGWGHGLGLCQAGAYGMAASGADYREILAHYYQGTEIRSFR